MRIAYISADLGVPVFGHKGCSIHVQEFLLALLKHGMEVKLYAARLGGAAAPDLAVVPVWEIPTKREAGPAARELAALEANTDLLKVLAHDGPFDIIYERYSLFSYGGMQYARSIGARGFLEVNAPLIEEQAEYRTLVHRSLAEESSRRAFVHASKLIAVSDEVARYLTGYAEATGRVEVVPNGVDLDRFHPRKSLRNLEPETFTIGFVGSLKPWHGLSGLVSAFDYLRRRHQEARLLIVGDGPARNSLEQGLKELGVSEFAHFTGAVPHDDVPALLASMDVAVAPFPRLANFYFSPLKIYEYMAAGIPVVASRIGQLQEILQHGVTGLVYKPGDVTGLCDALECLLEDPQMRQRLGEAGRAWVARGHSWNAVIQRILELAECDYSAADACAGGER